MNAGTIISTWQNNDDSWKLNASNDLSMSTNGTIYQYIVSDMPFQDVFLESTFRMTGDDDGIGFAFDFKDDKNYKQLIYEGGGLGYGINKIKIFQVTNGARNLIYDNSTALAWTLNKDIKMSIRIIKDQLEFRLSDELIFTFEFVSDHNGSVGFISYSQIYVAKNITLNKVLSNTMTGKYRVVGQDNSDVLSEITVRRPKDSDVLAEITPRVIGNNEKLSELHVKHGRKTDVFAEIQPIGGVTIPAEIEVLPGNRMVGLFEVQEPPRLTAILNPTKDAFTRETSPYDVINYGTNNSLTVGRYQNEIYRSYIQFDLSDWATQNVIINTKLRLHYIGEIPINSKLEILTVDKEWSELGITHRNRPNPLEIVATAFTINTVGKYVDFEFTDVTSNWIKKVIVNNGFIVRASNETTAALFNFRARESVTPPELIVVYYDNRIYSTSRTQTLAEIFVRLVGDSDKFAEVTVSSAIGNRDKLAEIYVHRYEDPIDKDIEAEITVTRANALAEVVVSAYGDDEVLAELSVRSLVQHDIRNAEITVSKPTQEVELFVKYVDDIESEVTVFRWDDSIRPSEISVTREYVLSKIEVRYRSSVYAEVTVRRPETSEKLTEISITREKIDTEIEVKYREDTLAEITIEAHEDSDKESVVSVTREAVLSEIEVRYKDNVEAEITVTILLDSSRLAEMTITKEFVYAEVYVKNNSDVLSEVTAAKRLDDDKETEITVSKELVYAEINIKGIAESDIDSEITVRVQDDSDKYTEISITREYVLALITIVESSNIDAEIYVKNRSEILAEINIHVHDSVFAEIDIVKVNKLLAEISVTRTNIDAEIMVPYWDDSDVLAEVSARVLKVSDVLTEIRVRVKGGAYAFII